MQRGQQSGLNEFKGFKGGFKGGGMGLNEFKGVQRGLNGFEGV